MSLKTRQILHWDDPKQGALRFSGTHPAVTASYLSTASGQPKNLAGGVAFKIVDGTELVAKTNPDTGAVELNVPPAKVFKAGEANWFIPNVSQAIVDARLPNAPTNETYEAND